MLKSPFNPSDNPINSTDSIQTAVEKTQGQINQLKTLFPESGISSDVIANSAITEDKLLNGSVTENKISNNSISTLKLQNDCVTIDKLNQDVIDLLSNVSNFIGFYDASSNTPDINNIMLLNKGDYYIVSVGGTQSINSISTLLSINNILEFNGSAWILRV